MSNGDRIIPKPEEPNAFERGINLLDLAAKSAVYSAVQQPLDGVTQLFGAKAPQLFDAPKHYEFNTPEWYASTIGHGAGFMVPYLATSKATAGLGLRNGGAAKAVFDGGLSGFAFTPTAEGESMLAGRSLAAFNSSIMFGTQHFIATKMHGSLMAKAAEQPMLARSLAIHGMPISTRLAISTGSGTVAGLAALEATSLVSGNGLVTDKKVLIENAVASAATGFALDGAHLAMARFRPNAQHAQHHQEATQRKTQPTTDLATRMIGESGTALTPGARDGQMLSPTRAMLGDTPITPGNRLLAASRVRGVEHSAVADLISTEPHRQIGEWTKQEPVFFGSKEYKTETGTTFWQTPDGRIFHLQGEGDSAVQHIWAPYGTKYSPAYLHREPGSSRPHAVYTRHEPTGTFVNTDGKPDNPQLYNMYADATKMGKRPALTPELSDRLALSVPLHFEPDHLATRRILTTNDGARWEPTEVIVRVPIDKDPPNDITATDYIANYTVEKTVPGRRYQILSAEGAMRLGVLEFELNNNLISRDAYNAERAKLKEQSTAITLTEEYAQQLDAVRVLREIATKDPTKFPDQAEGILATRRALFLSPFGERLLPEHWGQFLDTLPNRKLIREIELNNGIDTDNPGGNTIADANYRSQRIRFFGKNNGVQQHVRRTLNHEWSHLAEEAHPQIREAYAAASKFERFVGREYATKNKHENWAVHFAEMLMDPNPELFLTVAHEAPIRTVLLGEALHRQMYNSPDHTTLNLPELQNRLDYIDQYVLPEARIALLDKLSSSRVRDVTEATAVLEKIASSDTPLVNKLLNRDHLLTMIDQPMESLAKRWSSDEAAALLQRVDLLYKLDPEQGESRYLQSQDVAARLRGQMQRWLRSDNPEHVRLAIGLAKVTIGEMGDSAPFRRAFDSNDLAYVATNNKDGATAAGAFTMLETAYAPDVVRPVAIDMIQNSTARNTAAQYLLRDRDTATLLSTVALLRKQAAAGDYGALSQPTIDVLYKEFDRRATEINQGRETRLDVAVGTLQRARLIQDIASTRFDLFDVHLAARLGRAAELETSVRQLLDAKRNGSERDKAEFERVMQSIPPGTFDGPAAPGIIILGGGS